MQQALEEQLKKAVSGASEGEFILLAMWAVFSMVFLVLTMAITLFATYQTQNPQLLARGIAISSLGIFLIGLTLAIVGETTKTIKRYWEDIQ